MIAVNLLIAFNLGLISTLHCWGMCGSIITAFSLGLPEQAASGGRIVCFNLGRVSSYTVAGIICGLLGAGLFELIQEYHGQMILQVLAAVILISIGLHLGGWFPQFNRIEMIGMLFWRRLQPLTRRLVPVDNPAKAFASGLIWGWLPCGLVYSVLLWNLAKADPVISGLNMLAFGLGTLPGMVTAGFAAKTTERFLKKLELRRILGALVIVTGLFSLWVPLFQDHSAHHGAHSVPSNEPAADLGDLSMPPDHHHH